MESDVKEVCITHTGNFIWLFPLGKNHFQCFFLPISYYNRDKNMHPAFFVIVFNYVTTAVIVCRSFLSRKWIFQDCNNYIMLVLFAFPCMCRVWSTCAGKRARVMWLQRKFNQMKLKMHVNESMSEKHRGRILHHGWINLPRCVWDSMMGH